MSRHSFAPPNGAQLSSLGALVTFSSGKKRGSGAVIETEDDGMRVSNLSITHKFYSDHDAHLDIG